jgi:hypothetical protein
LWFRKIPYVDHTYLELLKLAHQVTKFRKETAQKASSKTTAQDPTAAVTIIGTQSLLMPSAFAALAI